MFVPSLSWQNDLTYIKRRKKSTVFLPGIGSCRTFGSRIAPEIIPTDQQPMCATALPMLLLLPLLKRIAWPFPTVSEAPKALLRSTVGAMLSPA